MQSIQGGYRDIPVLRGLPIRRETAIYFGDDDVFDKPAKPKRRGFRSSSLGYVAGALFAISSAMNFASGYVKDQPINYFTGSMFAICSVLNISTTRMRRRNEEKWKALDAEIEKSIKEMEALYSKKASRKDKPWHSADMTAPPDIKPLDDAKPPTIN